MDVFIKKHIHTVVQNNISYEIAMTQHSHFGLVKLFGTTITSITFQQVGRTCVHVGCVEI